MNTFREDEQNYTQSLIDALVKEKSLNAELVEALEGLLIASTHDMDTCEDVSCSFRKAEELLNDIRQRSK